MRLMCRGPFRTYRYTILAVLLGIVALSVVVVFEGVADSVAEFSAGRTGDLLLLVIPLSMGFALDMRRRACSLQRQNEQDQNRLAVLRATMVAMNDIVLDFLGHLQVFRQKAETHDGLPTESLRQLDDQIHNTSAKLRHLGDMDTTQVPGPSLETGMREMASPVQIPVSRAETGMAAQSCGPR